MAEEKQHRHHLFQHHKEEEKPADEVVYGSETTYIGDGYGGGVVESIEYVIASKTKVDYDKELKHHKHKEHLSEVGAMTANAFALHEKHRARKDPEHAHRHKIEEEMAAAVAVGGRGYAFHEHHEKKEAKGGGGAEKAQGKKHHHLF